MYCTNFDINELRLFNQIQQYVRAEKIDIYANVVYGKNPKISLSDQITYNI